MDFRRLRHALGTKLGAIEDKGSDHSYYYMDIEGKQHRIAKLSHSSRGSEQINDFIINDTAKRMHLEKTELVDFASCSISKDGYIKIWKERNKQIKTVD
jgi:hypothetical protein